jgi:hypothetical protein
MAICIGHLIDPSALGVNTCSPGGTGLPHPFLAIAFVNNIIESLAPTQRGPVLKRPRDARMGKHPPSSADFVIDGYFWAAG